MAVAIDRREGIGIGVAVIGHAALFALLWWLTSQPEHDPLKIKPVPIEVSLTDEAGLVSEAPVIEKEAPAERLAEVPAPPEPDSPPPVPEQMSEPVPAVALHILPARASLQWRHTTVRLEGVEISA